MNPSVTLSERVTLRGIPAAAGLAADIASICAAAGTAYLLSVFSYGFAGWGFSSASKVFSERMWSLPLLTAGIVGWFFLAGHYHAKSPFWDEARKVFNASAFALMAEGFLLFAGKADGSRTATFMTWITVPFFVMAGRDLLRHAYKQRGRGEIRAIVVGRTPEASAACRAISSDRHLGYRVMGVAETFDLSRILEQAADLGVDTAVIALSGDDSLENDVTVRLREAGYRIVLVPPSLGFAASGLRMQYVIGHDSVLLVDKVDVVPRLAKLSKRLFDITVTISLLAVVAIPMLAVGVLVRCDGGPAIFEHERIGRGGRKFRCLKFRSMSVDSDALIEKHLAMDAVAREEWRLTRKLKDDPRVTRLGQFIRKTALDELPQLLNVLRGDMSLVGPRPVTEPELDYYGAATPLYLSVRPGITGLWQVSGRNDLSYEERVGLDAWYVRNWSPWHDTAILLKTVPALVRRRGAY